jgi:hypothetical protein
MVASMDLTKTLPEMLKDAAYVTVGFGVIAWNKSQVRRRELESKFSGQTAELRSQLAKVSHEVETRIEPLVEAVDAGLDRIEGQLPDQAREAFKSARTAAKAAQDSIRARLAETNGAAA